MARWSGWGAGPAGAGSARPSRLFLGAALVACVLVAALLARDRNVGGAVVAAAAAVYFALRLSGAIGRGTR